MEDRNYDLEEKIKNYILNNKEVSQQLLIKHLKSNYAAVKKSLEDMRICLLPKSWHTENKVLKAYNSGLSTKEIGEELNLAREYVRSVLSKLSECYQNRRNIEIYSKEEVLESYNRGNHTLKELATDLNVSKSAASRLKIKFGLPPERKGLKKKDYPIRDRILRLGYSQPMVAEIEGVTRSAIYEYLEKKPKIRKAWEKARKSRKKL